MNYQALLFKNAQVYSPTYEGQKDIYVAADKIIGVEDEIRVLSPYLQELDCRGKIVVPGFVDCHVHVTGGGGEGGFDTRVPESKVSELVGAGVTTVLGLLGTDSLTRSLENLYAKAKALEVAGISTYMLTGAYTYPSPTITGSVLKDIAFIDKAIGVKIAASDHRSSFLSTEEFARLCSEARIAGLISNKAGLVVVHMGNSPKGFAPIYDMLNFSDLPLANLLPTHCGRSDQLFTEAVDFALAGGNIDLTGQLELGMEKSAASRVKQALEAGVPLDRLTISSDNYGSLPVFDELNNLVGIAYSRGPVLYHELLNMVNQYGLDLQTALPVITSNVANRMKLDGKKGQIAAGYDADLVILDENLKLEMVIAKGRIAYQDGVSLLQEVYG